MGGYYEFFEIRLNRTFMELKPLIADTRRGELIVS